MFVENTSLEHALIFEDDIYTFKDIGEDLYINEVLLEKKDLVYLGCHNNRNRIYEELNETDVFMNVKQIPYLIYGTYAIIISRRLAKYILNLGVNTMIQMNLSWDLVLNYIRLNSDFQCYLYFKQLFAPDVLKDGINGIRNQSFYSERGIDLNQYYL
jgi:GR25 family glycosyltransferase involved in LPS biosynthesis